MKPQVVLSLFPGADLFGRAFEELGFCVVRGPEKLLGQDIRDFHVPAGRFDGVIGGPPCQGFSTARGRSVSRTGNLIPEFVRLIEEAEPSWFVMENLVTAVSSISVPGDWPFVRVRDWDCGGYTKRRRCFWVGPAEMIFYLQTPPLLPGKPEPSLLATDGRRGASMAWKNSGHPLVSIERACCLQGFPGLFSRRRFMTKEFAVHLLGNGVPRAMGLYVARAVKNWLEREGS